MCYAAYTWNESQPGARMKWDFFGRCRAWAWDFCATADSFNMQTRRAVCFTAKGGHGMHKHAACQIIKIYNQRLCTTAKEIGSSKQAQAIALGEETWRAHQSKYDNMKVYIYIYNSVCSSSTSKFWRIKAKGAQLRRTSASATWNSKHSRIENLHDWWGTSQFWHGIVLMYMISSGAQIYYIYVCKCM